MTAQTCKNEKQRNAIGSLAIPGKKFVTTKMPGSIFINKVSKNLGDRLVAAQRKNLTFFFQSFIIKVQ